MWMEIASISILFYRYNSIHLITKGTSIWMSLNLCALKREMFVWKKTHAVLIYLTITVQPSQHT